MKNSIIIWLKEIRANFLVLAVVLVMIGVAAAWHDGSFNSGIFIITLIGVVTVHISVNLFNEYSDWKTGIDENTERTPFSGGSGNLQKGLLKPFQVRLAAWITLTVAFFIGLGLAWISGWPVLILMGVGGIATVFYTDYLAKLIIGELAAGITLGSFVVIGTYFVQTGEITSGIIWASVSPGILTMLLLLLNEFPDIEADRAGGFRYYLFNFFDVCLSHFYSRCCKGYNAGHCITVFYYFSSGCLHCVQCTSIWKRKTENNSNARDKCYCSSGNGFSSGGRLCDGIKTIQMPVYVFIRG